eukprot:scaffold133_cov115-Cylindrotheca_fusiformis.AAC.9
MLQSFRRKHNSLRAKRGTNRHENDDEPCSTTDCFLGLLLFGILFGSVIQGLAFVSATAFALSDTPNFFLGSVLQIGSHIVELCGMIFAALFLYMLTSRGSISSTRFFNDHFRRCRDYQEPWTGRSSFMAVVLFEFGFFSGTMLLSSAVERFNGNLLYADLLLADLLVDLPVFCCIIYVVNHAYKEEESAREDDESGREEDDLGYQALTTV